MDLNQQMLSDLAAQLGLEDNAQSAVKGRWNLWPTITRIRMRMF